jgi:hypothetical protein
MAVQELQLQAFLTMKLKHTVVLDLIFQDMVGQLRHMQDSYFIWKSLTFGTHLTS